MASHSSSEGEIIETDTEKATTAPSPRKGTSVNRKLRDALSPSPELSPRLPRASTRSVSRDRSSSPYRSSLSPRGEKRRRNDDYYGERARTGPRHFRVHYEDRSDRHRYDGRHGKDKRLNYDDRPERTEAGYKRQRTRSRSPGYDSRSRDRNTRTRDRTRGSGRDRRNLDDFKSAGYEQSVHDDPRASHPVDDMSMREAEHSINAGQVSKRANNEEKRPRFLEHDSEGQPLKVAREIETIETAPVDEASAIEERRRRREAIKAKYKSSTPLLVQALQPPTVNSSSALSSDQPTTPRSDRSVSPVGSPTASISNFVPGSPQVLNIESDEQLANARMQSPSSADEPSAADYDPTMDMEEDRHRNDLKRHNGEDASAIAYDEKQDIKRDILLPKSIVRSTEIAPAAKPAGDDMFASDDDDDMFAAAAPKKAFESEPEKAIAVPLTTAKELDMSLLDDWDDHEGYYKIILGELLDGRYHVQANLGKGMFSGVVRAMDTTTNELKAIKVIRNNETMIKAGTKEMEILQLLADADPEDKKHLVRLDRSFTHKGHLCMVFEHLSINLREVLKKFGRDVGINLKAVRSYAQQMFLGLSLLRKCNILHADLKPDNVLVNDNRNLLKICDLGSAADASENDITPYLVSRFYRAPEIILGVPYDFAIDMWSIGCTLFELYTGKILFTGRTNNQMLRSIMECRGKFNLKLLKKAEYGALHFDDQTLHFRSMERDKITGKEIMRLINFAKPTRDLKTRLMTTATGGSGKVLPEAELKEVNLFADLLDRCLALNPEKRITPQEALKHPFISRIVKN